MRLSLDYTIAEKYHCSSTLNGLYSIFLMTPAKKGLDNLFSGSDATIWEKSICNKLGRLSHSILGQVQGTKVVIANIRRMYQKNKKFTYINMVCDYRSSNEEKYRLRLTIREDKLDYDSETASPTTNSINTKILVNSIISDAHNVQHL